MSTMEDKIASYEAKITFIKSGGGIYKRASDKEKLSAIHDLRVLQGMFLMVIMLCLHTTILICRCVLFAFY